MARTESGKRLRRLVHEATLDPAIAVILSRDGRQQLLALTSIDLVDREVDNIEEEAVADLVRAARAVLACGVGNLSGEKYRQRVEAFDALDDVLDATEGARHG